MGAFRKIHNSWFAILILFAPVWILSVFLKIERSEIYDLGFFETAGSLIFELFLYVGIILFWRFLLAILPHKKWQYAVIFSAFIFWLCLIFTEIIGYFYILTTGDKGLNISYILFILENLDKYFSVITSVIPNVPLLFFAAGVITTTMFFVMAILSRMVEADERDSSGKMLSLGIIAVFLGGSSYGGGLAGYKYNATVAMIVDNTIQTQSIFKNSGVDGNLANSEYFFEKQPVISAENIKSPQKNVVIVLLESVGSDDLTVFNPDLKTTPFLKKLSETSLVAERAYAIVPHTSKSNTTILCGLTPYNSWQMTEVDIGIPVAQKCLPEILQDYGYDSVYFNTPTKKFESRDKLASYMGFKDFYSLENYNTYGFSRVNYFGYEDAVILKKNKQWLQTHKNRPFIAAYMTLAPHHDYKVPASIIKSDFSQNTQQNNYLNNVKYLDRFLSQLMYAYKAQELYENTIFIFVGDHGQAFGEHGRTKHDHVMYEEVLRTPIIIHNPGEYTKKVEISEAVSHLDVVPTILDMLGLEAESGSYEGRSLLKPEKGERILFSHCFHKKNCMAAVEGQWKLISYYGSQPDELYNLTIDPAEKHSLIEKYPEKHRYLKERLFKWRGKLVSSYEKFFASKGKQAR